MKRLLAKILAAIVITTTITNIGVSSNIYANTMYRNNQESTDKNEKWNLVWEDNFNGDYLNLQDWNYETHEPCWVNNELQEYTDDIRNIYVDNGNLVIKAIKEETEDGIKYTSGKVTTQNKHDYKYGRFEARLKVPEGQGLWPAFWMMPTEEELYGSWPRCGEIDIMEVLGHEPNEAYGTIHYGNPHQESQGSYILNGETFSDDYHVFAVEWEPSEMRFYIDGNLYHTVNNWYTKQEGGDEITYPAPFDQPFYLQFNLAVGGNWPGNPDETTNFDNAEYKIDYVRVYQLENYNENVPKPEKPPVDLREPDTTGNYIINSDFSEVEDLEDNVDWYTLKTLGGEGKGRIEDNKIVLSSESSGKENYSLQLVQAAIPLKKNNIYRLSFDARAAENRDMVINITSPDRGYIRQLQDTTVDLKNEFQKYSYEFTMKDNDDANARVEFNYGNRNSLADIEITNVRLEKIGEYENVNEDKKKILPNGNYVYNGTFDVGEDRMKYWEVDSKIEDVQATVTNINNKREFKISIPKSTSNLSDVILRESELGIAENKEYYLSFDAYAEEDKTIKAQINNKIFEAELTTEKKNFKYKFNTQDVLENRNLEFLLGTPGVTYVDNVKIMDTSLIINGDFSNEFSKWEVFKESSISSDVSSIIDKYNGNNAAQINISNTGDADWKIQLKQSGVKLEKGKKYKLSLDAKSTIKRAIMFTIQRDVSNDNDWRPYANTQIVDLENEYNKYEIIFDMTEESDSNSIFSISMGAVNNTQITEEHSIYIDNVNLIEVVESEDDDNTNNPNNPNDPSIKDDIDDNNNNNGSNGNNGNNNSNSANNSGNNNNANNKVPSQDKNTNSTLVETGKESYLALFGVILVLLGIGITGLNKKYKKQTN